MDDVVANAKPVNARPELHLAFVACFAKAEVFAVAELVDGIHAVADKFCACKTPECRSQATGKVQTMSYTLKSHNQVVLRLPASHRERLERADTRLGTCSGGTVSLGLFGSEEADRMSVFADEICDCKDTKCAEGVQKAMTDWVQKHFKGGKKKGTKAMVERWKAAQRKYADCYTKLLKASMSKPTTPATTTP